MDVGEVWEVNFPFDDDDSQSKRRPCVIMDIDTLEVLSLKVTTHEPRDEYDIPIFKWRDANLLEPSFARVSKVAFIKKNDFLMKNGELELSDFSNITKAFKRYFK